MLPAVDIALAPLPPVHFVLAVCDAADASRPVTDPLMSHFVTYPCSLANCMEPAAFGCMHCSRHGGRGARQLIERCAHRLAAEVLPSDGPRRILFVARSSAVRDAYKRALSCVAAKSKFSSGKLQMDARKEWHSQPLPRTVP